MKRKMHAKTLALVLATTTALQATGIASQLLNGVPFEVANASTLDPELVAGANQTTQASVIVSGPDITGTTPGQVFVSAVPASSTAGNSSIMFTLKVPTNSNPNFTTTQAVNITWSGNESQLSATGAISQIGGYTLGSTLNYKFTTVNSAPPALTVTGVNTLGDINVANGTAQSAIQFPSTVGVTFSDGSTGTKAVTNWTCTTTYNPSASGEYIFNGDVADSTTKASVKVIVAEAEVNPPVEVDKYGLKADIADAKVIYNAAVEGTEIGQYEVGSKATFKQAIDAAQAVVDDANATQDEVNDQVDALAIAVGVFEAAKITDASNPEVAMPSAVIITGTEKVGKTLTAQLLKEDSTYFTASLRATYKWYRLDNRNDDISEDKLVEDDDDYKLTGSDKNKYIKLVVTYNGKTFEDVTSKIAKNSSSSSSSSSSNSNSSSSSSNSSSSSSDDDSSDSSNNGSTTTGTTTTTGVTTATLTTSADGTAKLVDKSGQPATGWQQVNGVWYLANATGTVQTGWQQVNGAWYLLASTGSMQTGWQQVNGKWYLLASTGSMQTGWQQVNGKWYYLYTDGSMASNTVVDGYRVDASGAWV